MIENKVYRGKKAQAAMEFLTTYGWAILILIIVIVALANLGVFRGPSTPNTCSVRAPFACSDVIVKVAASGQTNPGTPPISNVTLQANNVASLSIGTYVSNAGTCSATGQNTFNGNGVNYVNLTCAAGSAGEKIVGQFDVTYTLVGIGTPHTTTVRFSATRE